MQSEAVFVGLLMSAEQPVWRLLVAASAGNILGSVINWALGRFLLRFQGRRWFPVSQPQLMRAQSVYQRWGRWSLLVSWMPIIGDPLTLVAGILRERFWVFLVLVTIAKAGRYLVLAAATLAWL